MPEPAASSSSPIWWKPGQALQDPRYSATKLDAVLGASAADTASAPVAMRLNAGMPTRRRRDGQSHVALSNVNPRQLVADMARHAPDEGVIASDQLRLEVLRGTDGKCRLGGRRMNTTARRSRFTR